MHVRFGSLAAAISSASFSLSPRRSISDLIWSYACIHRASVSVFGRYGCGAGDTICALFLHETPMEMRSDAGAMRIKPALEKIKLRLFHTSLFNLGIALYSVRQQQHDDGAKHVLPRIWLRALTAKALTPLS
jgi:hypothetical protein